MRACGEKHEARGYCRKHYRQIKTHGRLTPELEQERHGMYGTRIYKIWSKMKERCRNPNSDNWEWYGGKGIRVCDEWKNSFTVFNNWAKKSGYTKDLTIDRIDSNRDYCPNNCQWLSQSENSTKAMNERWIKKLY